MKKSYPEKQLKKIRLKRRKKALSSALAGTISIFAGSMLLYHLYDSIVVGFNFLFLTILALFLGAFLFFFLVFIYLRPTQEELKMKAGVEGESYFRKYLENFDGYKFYSVPLPHGGDIDALLVSDSGIFAFEVKNYSGIIRCQGDTWSRTKIGKRGGRYSGHVGNPSEEAKRHARDLEIYLGSKGIDVKVKPVVIITNSQAKIQDSGCSVPVIKPTNLSKLLQDSNRLEPWKIERIRKEIRKLIKMKS
jgi:hypothetical protein